MTVRQPGAGAQPARPPGAHAPGAQPPDSDQLRALFALMEAASLLEHRIEQHLRAEGGISYVQFQLLARLADASGPLTMTQLADGVVYSRSGLTYQAGLLEQAGLVNRDPSADDDRATVVSITPKGLALFGRVLPGHVQVTRRLLFDPLSRQDVLSLGDIMTRVRDHMRAQPPRSAAPRKRRPAGLGRPEALGLDRRRVMASRDEQAGRGLHEAGRTADEDGRRHPRLPGRRGDQVAADAPMRDGGTGCPLELPVASHRRGRAGRPDPGERVAERETRGTGSLGQVA
jgi:DNA-binding MarR family transcriptional regulator